MLNSFSVIIPALNKENEIVRTLESVDASIDYFFAHHDPTHAVEAEVIVVNEGSSDRTLEQVTQFSQGKPHIRVISHFRRMSAGTARNTGVKVAKGDVLFFCDGDDLYFPEHIYLCFQILNHDPHRSPRQPLTVNTNQGSLTLDLPHQSVGVIRTGVYTQDPLHPYWKVAVENSIPQNLCVRRDCHEFIEGFPEEKIPYNQITCEDISYQNWLSKFFKILKVNIETVEYVRYPGNMFDKQLKKFQTPPDQYQDDTPPDIQELHIIRQKIEQERFSYLFEKLRRIEKTPDFLAVLNWQSLGTEYLSRNQFEDAILLLEQGISLEPDNLDGRNLLAAACNNMGTALRGRGELKKATQAFKQALDVNPPLSNSDLAKVHFNLATSLRDQADYEQALIYLQKAVELEPSLTEAGTELSRLKYQVQVAQRGYQFPPDRFGEKIPLLTQHLSQFVGRAGLKVLELGSKEGRTTCWLIDHILTHPSARITCINLFAIAPTNTPAIEQQFDTNIAKTGWPEKVMKVVENSQIVLRSLPLDTYDIAYLSGSTLAADALEEALLTWRLVKLGGVIVFDYAAAPALAPFQPSSVSGVQEALEPPPRTAIDSFITIFSSKIRLLHQGTQVILEKKLA